MTRTFHLRDLFRIRWTRPVSDYDAGRILALKAADKRRREALTIQERRDEMNRRLRAERDAGWNLTAGSK
jgi:hypothetical protein